MFLKVQLKWNIIAPAESLDAKGLTLQKSILIHLLDDFAAKKATNNLGYLLAVTTVDSIGEGRVRQHTGDLIFPVTFTCLAFKLFTGEILKGEVHKIMKHGVFLKCGPIEKIFLSDKKMQGYSYVPGESPVFMSEKTAKIEKGVIVRVMVLAAKYVDAEREYQALVTLDGHFLGPV